MTQRTPHRHPTAPGPAPDARPPSHLPGEFLVRFRPEVLRAAMALTRGAGPGFEGARIAAASNPALLMQHLHDRFGLKSIEPVFTLDPLHALVSRFAGWQQALARTVGDALTRACTGWPRWTSWTGTRRSPTPVGMRS